MLVMRHIAVAIVLNETTSPTGALLCSSIGVICHSKLQLRTSFRQLKYCGLLVYWSTGLLVYLAVHVAWYCYSALTRQAPRSPGIYLKISSGIGFVGWSYHFLSSHPSTYEHPAFFLQQYFAAQCSPFPGLVSALPLRHPCLLACYAIDRTFCSVR